MIIWGSCESADGQGGRGSGAHGKIKWSERVTEQGEWLITEARGVKYLRFFR